MKRIGKQAVSVLLSWALLLGSLPVPAWARLITSDPMYFTHINLSGAGANQIDDWVTGAYAAAMEVVEAQYDGEAHLRPEGQKAPLMLRAMRLDPQDEDGLDPQDEDEYFFPQSASDSVHELTLYGNQNLEPSRISITGASVMPQGEIVKHVYGDGDRALYYYTLPISVPNTDTTLGIQVDGATFAEIPLTHVSGASPVSLFSTLWVKDYTENQAGLITSLTLQVSGFALPDVPAGYALTRGDWASEVPASSVTEADQYGYRLLTFSFPDGISGENLSQTDLRFTDYPAYFFGKGKHLTAQSIQNEPQYRFKTDYDFSGPFGDTLPGGTVASYLSPYYCLYKEPGKAPETVPTFTLSAANTQDAHVTASIRPGSYATGTMALSLDDGNTWGDWRSAADSFAFELPSYGVYNVALRFSKKGYQTYTTPAQTVDYNDGMAAAPVSGGVLTPDGQAAPQRGGAFVLTGEDDAAYTFYAAAPAGQTLEAIFDGADGGAILTRDMAWDTVDSRYELTLARSALREAVTVRLRVKAAGGGLPGHELSLTLRTIEPAAVKTIYAPTVSYEIKKDAAGATYYAVAPGAQILGVFEATTDENRTQRMTLRYVDTSGATQTHSVPATDEEGNGQFRATVKLPENVDRLRSLSYELVEDGSVASEETFDLSNYRVWAETNITGIPAAYVGATLTITGGGTERYAVLTEDNCARVNLGDLPTGSYAYELTGASGHIHGGTVAVTRGEDAELTGLPVLGSVTVTTTGFTSALTGNTVNPPAQAVLTLTAPDGMVVKAYGAAGVKMSQIPLGSTGTATIDYNAADYEEISGCAPASQSVTVSGDETLSFAFQPFTFRTISGSVWGVKTYPAGYKFGFVPAGTTVVVTQQVTRGGQTETYTQSATVKNANHGQWSIRCYDHIPATVEVRALTWDTQTRSVTAIGDVALGQIDMTYGNETIIALRAKVATPASVKADGSNYFSASDSVQSSVDGSFLKVSRISTGNAGYAASDGKFEVYTENGQAFLKVKPGVMEGNGTLYVTANGSTDFGGMSLSVLNATVRVTADENGIPTATFTAINQGGELRATVVEDEDSGMTGFLVLFTSDHTCYFAAGTGELSIPYSSWNTGKTLTVVAVKMRAEDAADFTELLNESCTRLWNLLPAVDSGMDKFVFDQRRGNQIKYQRIVLPQNRYVYLENMQPSVPVGTELLTPYKFTYHFETSDNPDKVWLIGTLAKRFPDQINQNNFSALLLFVPDRDDFANAELSAQASYYVNGKYIDAPLTWGNGGKSIDSVSVTAELPLSSTNEAAFSLRLGTTTGGVIQEFTHYERIPMFTLASPGDVYIADQLRAQGLEGKPEAVQAGWKLNLAMRAFATDKPEENVITICDNGTPIKKVTVSQGRANFNGDPFTYGHSMRVPVQLTDNLRSGIHVVWATRTLNGETIQTEPVAFTLVEGAEHNEVYVSNLRWTHWNSRIGNGEPDVMYFANLSDLAGQTIWIWPGKCHQMQFRVNNATSRELEGVSITYRTLADRGIYIQDASGNVLTYKPNYITITQTIPCKLIAEDRNANYSTWGFDDVDMGYLQSFEFNFTYNPAIEKDLQSMTYEELDRMETEAFYKANGLGELPDEEKLAENVLTLTDAEMTDAIASLSETSDVVKSLNLNLQVTENTDSSFRMELKTPTKDISEYVVTMQDSGTMSLPNIWMLMQNERENGNQNPDEAGWDVVWAEMETAQGATLIRIATFEGIEENTARAALLSHTTYYVTKSVADKLSPSPTPTLRASRSAQRTASTAGKLSLSPDASLLASGSLQLAAAGDNLEGRDVPAHWTKQVYDFSSAAYSNTFAVGDIGVRAFEDILYYDKLSNYTNVTKEIKKDVWNKVSWSGNSKTYAKLNRIGQVLGVVDTALTFYNRPSESDTSGIRALLSHVKDENARRTLELQIRDYEKMQWSIYKSDCTMSTISTASGFVPGVGLVGKVVTFIGGLGNSIISSYSKDFNRQVYNTTLHDIQFQLRLEARRAEAYNKSRAEAEQWLRDKMDRVYGKGAWSEYALEEERRYYELKEFPGGVVKYVWKNNAPSFDTYIDPSGFVYEAVEDDRLENVTATLYYSATENGSYSVWTDPTKTQCNPQQTADTGRYSWMVPTGWWKVRYEMDGYLISETKPMHVPPIHTAVNIGMLSTEAPKAVVTPDAGTFTVLFSKYMQLESLIRLFGTGSYDTDSFDASAFTVQFYDAGGAAITGTVSFPDRTANTGYTGDGYGKDVIDSAWFVRTAIFTPYDPTVDLSRATWKLADGMVSYAGVALDKNAEATGLFLVTLDPNGGELSVSSLATKDNGKLNKLPSPTREGYTFGGWYTSADGGTHVTVDTVFTENTTIYAKWIGTVATPVLPATGSFTGSKSISITCSTDGATIYYTTDGSIPTSASAVYTGAFTITDTTTVRAVAVKGGMKDSAIVSAAYTRTSGSGGSHSGSSKDTPTAYAVAAGKPQNGSLTINPTQATPGTTMYVTVTPDQGYALDQLTVTGTEGQVIAVTETDGRFMFIMPAHDVTVTARFKAVQAAHYSDVSETDWFYEAVNYGTANGYFKGMGGGKFAPNSIMTRAMFAAVLYRMAGEPEVTGEAVFTDVENGQWYTDAIVWATSNHIIQGYGDGLFGTDDPVTREQMVVLFWRCHKTPQADADLSQFTDFGQISGWAMDAMRWAVSVGVVHGKGDGILDPNGTAIRAEVAQIVMNYDTKVK